MGNGASAASNFDGNFNGQKVLSLDSWLEPFLPAIAHRHGRFQQWKDTIAQYEGGYDAFSKGYEKFGLNVNDKGEIVYREWAPNATEAALIGDFSKSMFTQQIYAEGSVAGRVIRCIRAYIEL